MEKSLEVEYILPFVPIYPHIPPCILISYQNALKEIKLHSPVNCDNNRTVQGQTCCVYSLFNCTRTHRIKGQLMPSLLLSCSWEDPLNQLTF